MEDKKLDTIDTLLNELVLKTKLAFIKRFSYHTKNKFIFSM